MGSIKGRKQSPEHVAKRTASAIATKKLDPTSEARRLASWRKSVDMEKLKARCRTMAASQIGKIQPPEAIAKQRAKMMGRATVWLKGRKQSEKHRRAVSAYWVANPEKHNHYIDGRYSERRDARRSIEYRLWREKVFARDNWTCVHCGDRGGYLHADHIKPWATHAVLRYDLANGRTLCVPCHKKTPTYRKSRKKLLEIENGSS